MPIVLTTYQRLETNVGEEMAMIRWKEKRSRDFEKIFDMPSACAGRLFAMVSHYIGNYLSLPAPSKKITPTHDQYR